MSHSVAENLIAEWTELFLKSIVNPQSNQLFLFAKKKKKELNSEKELNYTKKRKKERCIMIWWRIIKACTHF